MKLTHLTHLQHMHSTGILRKRPGLRLENEMIDTGLIERGFGGNVMTAKGIIELAKSKLPGGVK